MRVRHVTVCCVVLGMCLAGCAQGPQAPPGWKLACEMDFKGVDKVPETWEVIGGTAKIVDGKLVLTTEQEFDAQLVLKEPRLPTSVRLEVDACLEGETVCDLSPYLNGDQTGYQSGYLLQFGAAENVENRLRVAGEIADDAKANTTMFVTPGKMHHVVAENDCGKLRLIVDGTEILSYTDTQPLQGAGHDQIGFYTWNCTLKIEKITIFTKIDAPK